MKPQRLLTLLASVILLLAAVACGGDEASTVSIANKGFAESFVLEEIYAQLLEDAGYTVERRGALGGTPVLHEAMINDELDIYPEYTGTSLLTILQMSPMSDRQEVYNTVRDRYASDFGIAYLEPAPMNNTQALAMQEARAEELGIRTFSDLAAQADQLVLAGPPEFAEREDGLPGLQAAYGGFEFEDYLGVDFGLRYPTLLSGDADVAVAFGTDGEIFANNLRVIEDDLNFYPPYQVAPVVREAVLDANPEIETILNSVAPLLTDEAMQQLNFEVTGEGREPADVARDFLIDNNLIDS